MSDQDVGSESGWFGCCKHLLLFLVAVLLLPIILCLGLLFAILEGFTCGGFSRWMRTQGWPGYVPRGRSGRGEGGGGGQRIFGLNDRPTPESEQTSEASSAPAPDPGRSPAPTAPEEPDQKQPHTEEQALPTYEEVMTAKRFEDVEAQNV